LYEENFRAVITLVDGIDAVCVEYYCGVKGVRKFSYYAICGMFPIHVQFWKSE